MKNLEELLVVCSWCTEKGRIRVNLHKIGLGDRWIGEEDFPDIHILVKAYESGFNLIVGENIFRRGITHGICPDCFSEYF